jgi:gluconate 2-dehydrogenase alpha chain
MNTEVPAERKLISLNPREARIVTVIFERMFPADENGPGATEIDVVNYVDKALAGPYSEKLEWYRLGLAALDRIATRRYGANFADCAASDQDELLSELEQGQVPEFVTPPPVAFFDLLRTHLQEGLFADPVYGGNRNKLGWKILNHPGVWLENSSEENLTSEPVTKGGKFQSLADLDFSPGRPSRNEGDERSVPCGLE